MKKFFLVALVGVVVLALGLFVAGCNLTETPTETDTQTTTDTEINVEEGDETSEDDHEALESNYRPYSVGEFEEANGQKRVLFFHAPWCPSCKAANEELTERASEIPEDVVVYKVDYDTETELKEKYGVTYQHTFVYVDAEGNELSKWNGGGLDEILEMVQ